MRNLRELFRLTGKLRHFIILLILRCPFDAFNTYIQANFLRYAFNAMNHNSSDNLYLTCLLYGVGCFLLFFYNGTVWTFYAVFLTKWTAAIRRRLFEHISNLSLMQLEDKASGYWITRLNADVNSAAAVVGQPLHIPHAGCAAVNILISSIFLLFMTSESSCRFILYMNLKIYGLAILFIIPQVLISQLFITKRMPELYKESLENTAQNTVDMNSLITCADTAILYDAKGLLLNNFEKSSLQLRKANMKMRWRLAVQNATIPIFGLGGYLVLLLAGRFWVINKEMTFGDLTSVLQYRGGILKGAMMLSASLMNIRASLAGVKRLNETMHIPEE